MKKQRGGRDRIPGEGFSSDLTSDSKRASTRTRRIARHLKPLAAGDSAGSKWVSAPRAGRASSGVQIQVNSVSDAMLFFGAKGRIVDCNAPSCRTFGYARRDLKRLMSSDVFDSRTACRFIGQAGKRGKANPIFVEALGRKKNGIVFPVEVCAHRVIGESEFQWMVVVRDISQRKRIEREMDMFVHTLKSIGEGVSITDLDGRIMFVNEAFEKMLGYSSEELKGRTLGFMRSDRNPKEIVDLILPATLHGGWQGELIDRRKNGQEFPVWVSTSAVYDESNHPMAVVSVVRDVTERKLAEERVARLNRLYSVLSKINEAIIRVRRPEELFTEACRIAVEDGLLRMAWVGRIDLDSRRVLPVAKWGIDEGYLDGIVISIEDVPEGRGIVGTSIRQSRYAICNNTQEDSGMELWRERGAQRGYRSCAAFPLRVGETIMGAIALYAPEFNYFDEEEIRLLDSLAADLSFALESMEREKQRREAEYALRQSEAQFLQSQKMEAIGRLAGGVAHDFNNLLTAIGGYSELVLSRMKEGDPLAAYVREIMKAGESATALTRQLLAFSRKQVLQLKVLHLNDVVSSIDKMLRRMIGEDIELQISLAADLGTVKADPGQLEQVLMNLAVNARDAMPEGGRLQIQTSNLALTEGEAQKYTGARPGSYVALRITDTGVGMDSETQARIFEPFFTTKEAGKGTGLGLSTVYGIVKQSNGYIYAESEIGRGTTFQIFLPRVDEAAEIRVNGGGGEPHPHGAETILLVEDDETLRSLGEQVLTKSGYKVLVASHGDEALRTSESFADPIHLMVTDLVMPQMSGIDLAGRLTAKRPQTRVLFVSGYNDEALERQRFVRPGTVFLQKPFTPSVLVRKVREVLDAKPAV